MFSRSINSFLFVGLSSCQAPFLNLCLAVSAKQWIAPELKNSVCIKGPSALLSARVALYSGIGTVHEFWDKFLKKGVYTLVPSEYKTRAPCRGTRCERCLRFYFGPGQLSWLDWLKGLSPPPHRCGHIWPSPTFLKVGWVWSSGWTWSWIGLLLLTVSEVSTTCAVVIFIVKVSCITSVDGMKL